MEDKNIEIDQESKETLLNEPSPLLNKREDSLLKGTPKKPKRSKTDKVGEISLTEEEVKDDSPILENEDMFKSPSELIEGKNLYNDTPSLNKTKEREDEVPEEPYSFSPKDAYDNSKFRNLETVSYGKGVEDYRDYLQNPIKSDVLDYNRALNQSNSEQFGRALARFGKNVIPEIIQQGANMVEGLYRITPFDDGTYGNPVSQSMQEFKDSVNQKHDIYLENPDKALALGDFAWWADRGSSLATSVAAFVALGYATGGAALGSRTANLLLRSKTANKVGGFLTKEIAKAGVNTAKLGEAGYASNLISRGGTISDTVLNAYLLTSAESIGSATEVYHSVREEKTQEYLRQGLSEEEALQRANADALKAGDRTFHFNNMNTLLNLTSASLFTKGLNTRISKFKPKTLLGGAKRLGLEAVQEGAEEGLNVVAEKFGTQELPEALKVLATDEGLEAMLLGAIGGVAQTGLTLTGQYIPTSREDGKWVSAHSKYKKNQAAQEEILDFIKTLPARERQNQLDIFKSLKEKVILNNELNEAIKEGNATKVKQIKEEMFTSRAYDAFMFGLAGDFQEQLEQIASLDEEQAKELGYDFSPEGGDREVILKRIEQLKKLESVYNTTENLINGKQAYEAKAQEIYLSNILDENQTEIGKYKEVIDPLLAEITEVSEGSFYFNEEDNVYELNEDELTKVKTEEKEKAIEDLKASIKSNEIKILKEQDRLQKINTIEGVDNSKQKEAISKTIENLTEEKENFEASLIEEEENLENITEELRGNKAKINHLYQDLLSKMEFNNYLNLLESNKQIKSYIEDQKELYKSLTSFEGQEKARKEQEEARKLNEELRAIIKQKEKEAKEEAKEIKKEEKLEEEAEEEEVAIHTDTDKKGREYTYFAITKTEKGITKTTFTFNRSDKDSTQRNTASVPTEVALGNKYTIPKETKNADGSMSDQVPENTIVHSVLEIREDDKGKAGATVMLQNKDDSSIRWKSEIVLEINTKGEKDTRSDNLKKLTTLIEEPTKQKIVDLLELNNESLINDLFSILNNTKLTSVKQTLLWGLTKKYATEDIINDNNVGLENINKAIAELKGDELLNIEEVKAKEDVYLIKLEDFLDSQVSKDIANIIDSSYNLEFNSEEEEAQANETLKNILENSDTTEDSLGNLIKRLLQKNNLTYDNSPTKNDSFRKVVLTLRDVLGDDLMSNIYIKLRGYLAYKTGANLTRSYDGLVKTKKQRLEELDKKNERRKDRQLEDYPTYTQKEIDEQNKINAKGELFIQGKLVEEIVFDSEEVWTSAKSRDIADKIAYKTIGSKRIYKEGVVDKEGIVDELNENLDNRLLLMNQIKEGDLVSFRLADNINIDGEIYETFKDNGIWVTKITDEQGRSREENALDFAPIQVFINGSLLEDAYLHLPSFINEENSPLDAELRQIEIDKLTMLREAALENPNLSTRIVGMSQGHLIPSVSRNTSINMPKVKVDININGFQSINDNQYDSSKSYLNGAPHALIKQENGLYRPVGLQGLPLSENKRNVVKELIKLRFYHNDDLTLADKRNIDNLKKKGFDIRSTNTSDHLRFRELLREFINLTSLKGAKEGIEGEFNIDKHLQNYKSNKSSFIINKQDDIVKIYAGRGASKGIELKLVGDTRPNKKTVDDALAQIDFALKNSYQNFKKENVGQGSYAHISNIGENGIEYETFDSYEDFIRENTKIPFKTIDINGEEVYLIQKSIYFEYPKFTEETIEETDLTEEEEDLNNFLNMSLDDLNEPVKLTTLEVSNEEKLRLKNNNAVVDLIFKSKDGIQNYIKDIPVEFQERFINSLINMSLERSSIKEILELEEALKPSKERSSTNIASKKDIKNLFVKNLENYINAQPNIEKVLNVIKEELIKNTPLEDIKVLAKFKDLKLKLEQSGNPIRTIEEKIEVQEYYTPILKKAITNVDKLMNFAINKLKAYSLLDSSEIQDALTLEENTKVTNNYDENASMTLNGKDQLTANVKTFLMGIKDAEVVDRKEVIVKNSKGENEVHYEPVIKNKTWFGLEESVPFDRLYNEVVGIFAVSNKNYLANLSEGSSLFDAFLNELVEHSFQKPYLLNLKNTLESLNTEDKNAFASNMSKSTINHITTYVNERFKKEPGLQPVKIKTLTNRKTNNSETSSVLLAEWRSIFYASDLVEEHTGEYDVKLNKEKVESFINKANALIARVKQYKTEKRLELESKVNGLGYADRLKIREQVNKPDEVIISEIRDLFSEIGFNLSTELLNHLYFAGYNSKGSFIHFSNLTADNGFLGALINLLTDKEGNVKNFNSKIEDIFNDGYIQAFAKYAARFENQVYAPSYSNGENKSIYGFALNKFMSDRVKSLKSDTTLLKDLSEDTFAGQHNTLLELIYDKEENAIRNNNFNNFFNYFTFDTNVVLGKDYKSNPLNKLSSAGYEQVLLNLFYNKGNKENANVITKTFNSEEKAFSYRNGLLMAPTFSDKKIAMGLNSPIFNIRFDNNDKLENGTDNVIYDLIIENVVMPEYNRILSEQDNNNNANKNKYKEGSQLFYFIPELNFAKDRILFDKESNRLKKLTPQLRKEIKEIVINHIETLKNNKIEEWKDSNIVMETRNGLTMKYIDDTYVKNGFSNNAERIAYEFVSNYLISNANYFKMFAGDPANYFKGDTLSQILSEENLYKTESYVDSFGITKNQQVYKNGTLEETIKVNFLNSISNTFDNVGKRLAAQVAPGTDILHNKGEKMKVLFLQDPDNVSGMNFTKPFHQDYYNRLNKSNSNDSKMPVADAQGYSTIEEFLNFEHKRGNISLQEKNTVLKLEKKDNLEREELNQLKSILSKNLMNIYKPVYFNNFKDEYGNFRSLYLKEGTMPLSKHLTKGLEIDKLRVLMETKGLKKALFSTAVKVGNVETPLNIFNADGSIKDNLEDTLHDLIQSGIPPVLNIPREGYKNQLDINIEKEYNTDGSQQRKLIFTDILNENFTHPKTNETIKGEDLRKEFNEYYVELFKTKYNDLAEKLEFNREDGKINLKVLQRIVKKEFLDRGYPLSDIEFLGITKNDEGKFEFKQPLWTSTISSKIESLLISLIDNRIRKLKSPGKGFTLGSNVGFKPKKLKEGEEAEAFIEANKTSIVYDKEWYERGDFTLRGQGIDSETGQVTPAEIMIPAIFRNDEGEIIEASSLQDENGFIDTKKLPSKLLKMFGYRIPTQGLNSMSYMKVVGFIPSMFSETIIAPAEFTLQMGSDFDIDKLYVNHYSYQYSKLKNFEIVDSAFINKGGEIIYKKDERIEGRLFNAILDIKLAVLSNPSPNVQRKIITPLDRNVFEDYSKEITELYGTEDFYSPISETSFKNKYLSGSTGTEAIGVFATASTLNAIMQTTDKKKEIFFQQTEQIDGRTVYVDKPRKIFLGSYDGTKLAASMALSDKKLGNSDLTKADVYSNLVTTAVDNENLQVLGKLNINNETYDFINTSIALGFNPELITYVINQPIIRRYVELKSKANDSSVETYFNRDIYRDLYEEFGGFIEETEEGKFTLPLIDYKELKNWSTNPSLYTVKDLKNNIKIRKENHKEKSDYAYQQTFILHEFLKMTKLGKKLNKVREAVNIDGSKGLGSSVIYLNQKQEDIYEIGNLGISNTIDLLGRKEVVTSSNIGRNALLLQDNNGLNVVVPSTILGGIFNYAVKTATGLLSENTLFPYKSLVIENLSDIAYSKLLTRNEEDLSFTEKVLIKRRALNLTKQYLFTNLYGALFQKSIFEERKRILVDTETNDSLASVLLKIKEINPDKINKNYLLNRLILLKGNRNEASRIEFNATDETTSMNFISDSLLSLAEDEQIYYEDKGKVYRGKDIALDLIRHQYLTGGVQFKKQFIKYIPFKVFEVLGISSKIRKYDLSGENTVQLEEDTRRFTKQLHQHFPENSFLISSEHFNMDEHTGLVTVDADKSIAPELATISYKGNLIPLELKSLNLETAIYTPLDKLGDADNNIIEFDSSKESAKSIVPFNDRLHQIEVTKNNYNKTKLNEILRNDIIVKYKASLDSETYSPFSGTFEEFEEFKKGFSQEELDNDGIVLISKKDELGVPKIYDPTWFKGMLQIGLNEFTLSKDFIEDENYQIIEREKDELYVPYKNLPPVKELSKKEKFEEAFNYVEGDTEQSMINMLEVLKENNTDFTTNYVYDNLIDAIPALIEENPNLKLKIVDSENFNSRVTSKNGKVIEIALGTKRLDSLEGVDSSNYLSSIHRLVVEEFLHAITMSERNRNNSTFKELDAIRKEVIEDLKNNNIEGYKLYVDTVNKFNNVKAIDAILFTPNTTIENIKSKLQEFRGYRNTSSYKAIEEALNEVEDSKFIDLTALKSKLRKDNFISNKQIVEYYPLTNTDEFIAAMFKNEKLQSKLNTIKSKNNKTLLERFFAFILRTLQKVSKRFNKEKKQDNWSSLFRQDINKDSVLEEGLSKSMILIKNFSKNKLNKQDRKIIKDNYKASKMSVSDINSSFNLKFDGEYQYFEKASEIANVLRSVFKDMKDVNVVTYKKNYIVVTDKNNPFDKDRSTFQTKEEIELNSNPENQERIANLSRELDELETIKNNSDSIPELIILDALPKITPESASKETGGKAGVNQDINPFFLSKEGSTVTNAAETILENNENLNLELDQVVDIIIDILNSGTPSNYRNQFFNQDRINELNKELKGLNNTNYHLEFTSEEEVNQIRQAKVRALNASRISKLKDMMNIALANDQNTRYKQLNEILEELVKDKELAVEMDSLEDLLEIASRDLKEVKKILDFGTLTFSDVSYVKQILDNWRNVYRIYFTKEEKQLLVNIEKDFSEIVGESEELYKDMYDNLVRLFEEGVKNEFGKDIDLISYFEQFKDVSIFSREGNDISRINNVFLTFIHQQSQKAFSQTKRETFDEVQKVEKLIKEAIPYLKKYSNTKNGIFNILLQKYEDGSLTGDLISPFAKEYLEERKKKFASLYALDQDERIKNSEKVNKWLLDNTIYFNPLLLYKGIGTEEEINAHKKELKDTLGEELYSYYMEQQTNLLKAYEEDRNNKLKEILAKYGLDTKEDLNNTIEANNEYKIWRAEHSPYIHYNQVMNKEYKEVELKTNDPAILVTKKIFNKGFEYLVNIPKDQKNYDSDFNKILQDKNIFKFYNAYVEVLQKLQKFLPQKAQEAIRFNGLPEIDKTFMENMVQGGFVSAYAGLKTTMTKGLRTSDLSQVSTKDINQVTGEENKFLGFNLFRNNEEEFRKFLIKKEGEYSVENKFKGSPSDFEETVRKEFNNMIAERKSKDLGKILKAYTGLALTYKHKSRIQDTIIAGEILLNDLKEPSTNADGKHIFDVFNSKKIKPNSTSYKNLKEMYAHYIENFFENPYKLQGITNKRMYTEEEKKLIKDYNKQIEAFESYKEELQTEYQNNLITKKIYTLRTRLMDNYIEERKEAILDLGGNFTYSKAGDAALKAFQLKGMGWNVLAGIGNLGYGVIGNLIESADGRIINRKEMLDAYSLVLNSIGRNATFNQWDGKNEIALKIRNLMDRNDILKEASHELYSNSVKGNFAKKTRFLSPYNVQKRTEYLNQAPIMVAFYKKTFFEHDGKQISLWDAYNNEGQWKDQYGTEQQEKIRKLINKTNSKITQFIKRVHGNYDPMSPMKIKQGVIGRGLAQFRTWLVESWNQRWEQEKFDDILEVTFKGRYRTVPLYFKEMGAFGGLIDIFKSMVLNLVNKRLTFDGDKFSEDWKDVDAANMRKLVSELQIYLSIISFYLAMSMIFRDDDELEKDQEALNLTLNMADRVSRELTIYINPLEVARMVKNPIPAMSLIEDLYNVGKSTSNFIVGNDEIVNGPFAGQSGLLRSFGAFVPMTSQVKGWESNSTKEFNKSWILKLLEKEDK